MSVRHVGYNQKLGFVLLLLALRMGEEYPLSRRKSEPLLASIESSAMVYNPHILKLCRGLENRRPRVRNSDVPFRSSLLERG